MDKESKIHAKRIIAFPVLEFNLTVSSLCYYAASPFNSCLDFNSLGLET